MMRLRESRHHVGVEQALQAKIMGMAQLAEPEEE